MCSHILQTAQAKVENLKLSVKMKRWSESEKDSERLTDLSDLRIIKLQQNQMNRKRQQRKHKKTVGLSACYPLVMLKSTVTQPHGWWWH